MIFLKKLGNFLISKSFLITLVLIALFWIILVWGYIWRFDSFTNHGEKIKVPSLVSNDNSNLVNIKQVPQLLEGKGLKFEVLDSIYKPDLVEGTIIYQDPLPTDSCGQFVKSGRVLKLRVSKRTRAVSMPNLVDKSQRYAEGILSVVGLRSKSKYVPSDVNGSIISATYKGKPINPGAKLPINSVIELTVGKKSGGILVNVPNLNGLTIKEAQSRLSDNGSLNLYVACAECITAQDSLSARVQAQTPVAGEGSMVPQGSTITAFATLNYTEVNTPD